VFQSSPDPKAGCYLEASAAEVIVSEFQSSPDPKAGCYLNMASQPTGAVLFQSSPDPKAGCYPRIGHLVEVAAGVSILTRPEGRVLPGR